jgi:hypothetical protein
MRELVRHRAADRSLVRQRCRHVDGVEHETNEQKEEMFNGKTVDPIVARPMELQLAGAQVRWVKGQLCMSICRAHVAHLADTVLEEAVGLLTKRDGTNLTFELLSIAGDCPCGHVFHESIGLVVGIDPSPAGVDSSLVRLNSSLVSISFMLYVSSLPERKLLEVHNGHKIGEASVQ